MQMISNKSVDCASRLSRQQADTEEEARRIAQTLRNVPQSLLMGELLQQVEHLQGADALVLTGNLTAVAAASGSKLDLILPSMPGHLQIQAAKNTGIYSTVEPAKSWKVVPNMFVIKEFSSPFISHPPPHVQCPDTG